MPLTQYSDHLHATKYRSSGESFREAMNRVANALKDSDDHFHELKETLRGQRFIPAGRVQSAMGSTRSVTAFNCFVSGTIEDSYVEGHGSIMARAHQAATTMRMGGGIGYDFSTLRPRGSLIRKLQSSSCGPVKFMDIFNAVCLCTCSSGHRRGAQMGVLRVDHPDIEEFIRAKQGKGLLEGFNISVAITDEFMRAVLNDKPFDLSWGGQVYRTVNARNLWDMLMRSTWDWADPGVLFIDRINQMNNLWYCEDIAATNPCGEQPLPPYGACLLGSFNLVKYLHTDSVGKRHFDWDMLGHDIPIVARAMDNVTDRTVYPLYEQEKEARSKRRMGLGYTGLANAGEFLGYPYGSPEFNNWHRKVARSLRDCLYLASVQLAQEKGAFPLFDAERYLQGGFVRTLPTEIQEQIRHYGIRNSHLTSIAPTGTISMTADNVSSGCEPVTFYEVDRKVEMPTGPEQVRLSDYGYRFLGTRGKTINDVTVPEHLAVLESAQMFVDSSVSKTVNVPEGIKWEDFKEVYLEAWRRGAKGCTTYRMGGKREGILVDATEGTEGNAKSCRIDPESGQKECE